MRDPGEHTFLQTDAALATEVEKPSILFYIKLYILLLGGLVAGEKRLDVSVILFSIYFGWS